jgi:hypothetical protein
MLSISFYDQIDKVPNTLNRVILRMAQVGYYYHLVNVISFTLPKIDHIKPHLIEQEKKIGGRCLRLGKVRLG